MIFSDNYTVEERYSLVSGKRLSDLSLMPWRYTPLYDDQYKPEMSVGVRNQLGVIFKYKPTFEQTLAIKDEHKLFGIYHNGDDIEGYQTRFRTPFSSWRVARGDYINQTYSSMDRDLYDDLDKVVRSDRFGNTAFLGHTHDNQGYITGCRISDKYFDVSRYNNPKLDKLGWFLKNANNYVGVIVTVGRDDKISWFSNFKYPNKVSYRKKNNIGKNVTDEMLNNTENISFRQMMKRHLKAYVTYEIITSQNVQDIIDLVPDLTRDAQVKLEHVFQGSELVDVIAHIPKYSEFKEVQVKKRWIRNTIDGVRYENWPKYDDTTS